MLVFARTGVNNLEPGCLLSVSSLWNSPSLILTSSGIAGLRVQRFHEKR